MHFVVLQRNGVAVSAEKLEFLDSITVPYWNGTGPYPSAKVAYRWLGPFSSVESKLWLRVQLRMDFTSTVAGIFVYHCHLIGHEDNGMMAKIQVDVMARSAVSRRCRV